MDYLGKLARLRARKKEKEESPWNVTVPGGPPRPRSNVIGESGYGGGTAEIHLECPKGGARRYPDKVR